MSGSVSDAIVIGSGIAATVIYGMSKYFSRKEGTGVIISASVITEVVKPFLDEARKDRETNHEILRGIHQEIALGNANAAARADAAETAHESFDRSHRDLHAKIDTIKDRQSSGRVL